MFTGIIETRGKVTSAAAKGTTRRLGIDLDAVAAEVRVGDSIALEGVCLTVTEKQGSQCFFDVVPETLNTTTLGARKVGDLVNVERSLRLSDHLGGHLVTGHIDGTGRIAAITEGSQGYVMRIQVPERWAQMMIDKGSVAVDGISLTIAALGDDWFSVALIPYTLQATTLGEKRVGNAVNIETDLIGKWVQRLLAGNSTQAGGLTLDDLKKAGFA